MTRRHMVLALVLGIAALPSAAFSLEDDRDQPLRVEARHVNMDEASGKIVYSGNVVAVKGSLRITADRAVIVRRQGRTEHLQLTGRPLTMDQKPDPESPAIHAEARRLEYDLLSGEVELFDDVLISQGDDKLKSAYVFYKLDGSVIRARAAEGTDDRVQGVFYPQSDKRDVP